MSKKRIAIVGSGCAGLGAFWSLKTTPHEVHLFEAAPRLGGHTNTVPFTKNGKTTPVDSGFIVMNSATYPNFIAFLSHLGIPTINTEMTFGVSRDAGAFEWSGTSLSALFAQRANLLRPRMWRMIFDIFRFNQFALDLLAADSPSSSSSSCSSTCCSVSLFTRPPLDETIGEYLLRENYSTAFRDDYLIPMTAAVWSTAPDKCSLEFPAVTLVRFMWNHHLLTAISARPTWMTIPGGAQRYIDAVMEGVDPGRIHLDTPIASLTSTSASQSTSHEITLTTSGGESHKFDHVILATHGDQALQILGANATSSERDILQHFTTSQNVAVLHSDLNLMPRRRRAWAAWNYLTESSPSSPSAPSSHPGSPPSISSASTKETKRDHASEQRKIENVSLTYNMNILQHLPANLYGDVLITLNPLHPPAPSTVQGTYHYAHPLYTLVAIEAQARLGEIQSVPGRGVGFAGAWTGYGFHEDGFTSGVRAGVAAGRLVSASRGETGAASAKGKKEGEVALPFDIVDSTYSRGKAYTLTWADWVARVILVLVQLLVIEGLGGLVEKVQGRLVRDGMKGGAKKAQ